MSWRKAKTPGWAAFDLKQQHKQDSDNETHNDPYPPISNSTGTSHHYQIPTSNGGDLTGRSFSSVIMRCASVPNIMTTNDTHSTSRVANVASFPDLSTIRDMSYPVHVGTSMENTGSEKIDRKHIENGVPQVCGKLKELHSWADENLIWDILVSVNHDIYKASTLLEEMFSASKLDEKNGTWFEDNTEEVYLDNSLAANTGPCLGDTTASPMLDSGSKKSIMFKNDGHLNEHVLSEKMLLNDNAQIGLPMDKLSSIPVEPEWEENDMYLKHRKEAIRMMRLASRHSQAATDAYLRRDHVAAQEFSLKARAEWSAAEKLNAKAAKEIVTFRNSKNDDWRLDLHGLHAAEAVQVLLEHLLKIEYQVPRNHFTNLNKEQDQPCFTQPASLESLRCTETEMSDKQRQSSRPRFLEVITGKGTHSRGQAALPVAIKSFLSEQGYYHYEARAGVITVQPKFRHL